MSLVRIRSLGWALKQDGHEQCPYEKGKFGHRLKGRRHIMMKKEVKVHRPKTAKDGQQTPRSCG